MEIDAQNTDSEFEAINPWSDIWLKPRATINWIITYRSSLLIPMLLIYLGSVYWGINQAHTKGSGDVQSTNYILFMAFFVSGIGGLIVYNFVIVLIDLTATWLGGKGNIKKTQLAFAWSLIPSMLSFIITIIVFGLFEDELFTIQTSRIDRYSFLSISLHVYTILIFILEIWHICLLLITLAEVQKISKVKAALSILIAALLIVLPVVLITVIYLSFN